MRAVAGNGAGGETKVQSGKKAGKEEVKRKTKRKKINGGLFATPAFQAATIGLPFCVYKLLFGILAGRAASDSGSQGLFIFSLSVIAWSLLDLLMNLARIGFDLAGRASPIEYCIIAQAGRRFRRPRLFLTFDTLLSFSIICIVLWSGWVSHLSPSESRLWNAATTLNLIAISVANIWMELQRGEERDVDGD